MKRSNSKTSCHNNERPSKKSRRMYFPQLPIEIWTNYLIPQSIDKFFVSGKFYLKNGRGYKKGTEKPYASGTTPLEKKYCFMSAIRFALSIRSVSKFFCASIFETNKKKIELFLHLYRIGGISSQYINRTVVYPFQKLTAPIPNVNHSNKKVAITKTKEDCNNNFEKSSDEDSDEDSNENSEETSEEDYLHYSEEDREKIYSQMIVRLKKNIQSTIKSYIVKAEAEKKNEELTFNQMDDNEIFADADESLKSLIGAHQKFHKAFKSRLSMLKLV